jgi:CHAD domain-containing protein
MAKARAIEGLDADGPYAAAAARIVEVRSRELLDHAHGVLDVSDIERLHDMRVATRRLRAALEIFGPCFPARELKATLREVKALADALGERRDRDVTIASLEEISNAMPAPDRPGIRTFSESVRLEQAAANRALERFVSPERLASLGEQLSELVASASPAQSGELEQQGELVQLEKARRASDNVSAANVAGGDEV